ncbi:uncharacterized protein LOC121530060 [Drosophila eugracilis]|uniref:uncharacterized protein LOC121530060 n=1 Tax=Drosophila eugracilis TaxID=29029 RepID=UPI001BD9D957|nr:uncharacterized protein LOC121530060 [Drosophila eugracilis]
MEKTKASYYRRNRYKLRSPEESDTDLRCNTSQISSKSRIPVNRSHSIPRHYISRNQLDRHIRAAVVDAFQECVNSEKSNKKSKANKDAENGEVRHHLKTMKEEDKKTIRRKRERSRSPESQYYSDSDTNTVKILYRRNNKKYKTATTLYANQEELTDESLDILKTPRVVKLERTISKASCTFISAFIRRCFAIAKMIINLGVLPEIMQFINRMSKSSLVSLVIIFTFTLIWAYEFGEPVDRIRTALDDLFKDRSRSWWQFL